MENTTMTKAESLEVLFNENTTDVNKNQSYKDSFKEYDLPEKYFLLEMYSKQKELQQFLADRGKTQAFPTNVYNVRQQDVQLAIYHLFCMQIEFQEMCIELKKLTEVTEVTDVNPIDTRYELIDMFFFMFNVGIYTGLDMVAVLNEIDTFTKSELIPNEEYVYDIADINYAIHKLMNYIDSLPWKAWKEYDYRTCFNNLDIATQYYAYALDAMVRWAKVVLKEDDRSLFNLYMNKWEENRRRQIDKNSGYLLNVDTAE